MNEIILNNLMQAGMNLASLAVSGTVTKVNAKIQSVKSEKDAEKLRNTYDEIVNEILSEREEAVRIAQAYKSELERVIISDEDIEHLHKTIGRLLEILKEMSPTAPIDSFEKFQELISIDTLKAMQLLGFNYKAAIGEPLTNLCANAISTLDKKTNKQQNYRTSSKR